MSFAIECKTELISVENNDCCATAQSYAMLLFGRAFSDREISLLTENEMIAQSYIAALKNLTGITVSPSITPAGNFKISITDREKTENILSTVGHNTSLPKRRVNFELFRNKCCSAAFLRGAFLVCGTVTDPEKEYHLEFAVSTKGLCDDLIKIFSEFGIEPKTINRSSSIVVYFKNSSDIEDVLAIMGAQSGSLSLMGTKMYKDIRNTVNRKVNFESANLARTIAAATKQFEAIEKIKETIGFDALPKELQEIAMLRYENTELSNSEIAKMLSEKISVSGVNHRFSRLIRIADDLKKN